MGPTTSPGLMHNRRHYPIGVLAGAGAAALLSVLPVISLLNLLFFFWIAFGGAIAAAIVQRNARTVPMREGAVIGAITGLVSGLITLLLFTCLAGLFAMVALPDSSSSQTEDLLLLGALGLGGTCGMALFVYPIVGAVGGTVAIAMFPADPSAVAAAAPVVPLTPEERAAQQARRTMTTRIAGLGCGVIALAMLSLCCVSGYLGYLENLNVDDTAGGAEIASVPLIAGQPAVLVLPANTGAGTARYGLWVVTDGPLPPGVGLAGRMGCDDYGDPTTSEIYSYYAADPDHPEWLYIGSEYLFMGRPATCRFEITLTPPVPAARIVVTQLSRPSDWLD